MIRIPNKLSFKYYLSLSILVVALLSFFIQALLSPGKCFQCIILILLLSIGLLVFFQRKLNKKLALIRLERQDFIERINLSEAEVKKESQAIESLRDKVVNYASLKDIVEKLCLCLTLTDTSKTLCAEVNRFFGHLDITTILYLFYTRTGELALSCSHKGEIQINLKTKKGDVFDLWVLKTRQSLLIENTKSDFRFDSDQIVTEDERDIRSLMSVPLMIGNNTLGILRLDSPNENSFKTDDLRLLATLADVGAVAIDNAFLYERVEDLAIRDSLTGLYLRRYLLERMTQELSRVLRAKKELSFLMIDLDHFKKYNDQFGHVAGDILLRQMSMILSDYFRQPGDLVCRYGGEEFAVLLPECPKEKAIALAQEVRKKIEAQEIFLRRLKTSITVSIGVASFPKDAQLRDEIIQKADQALYRAKEKGRNRVWPSK